MSSIPSTQKALVMPAAGASYTVSEVAVPRPGPSEILVKLQAVGLNPVDWKVARPENAFLITSYPFTPGSDGAGVIVDVGDGVANFAKGDRILFQGSRAIPGFGAFQEYCLVRYPFAAKIPENISFEAAVTIPATLGSVLLGLYNQHAEQESLGLKPFWSEGGNTAYAGKPIFILGGATSLGQHAIQAAKHSGFHPIITTASPHNAALLTSLGATHVLDRRLSADAILAELQKLTDRKPLEVVFDTVSDVNTESLAYRATSPGGGLVLVLPDVIPAELKKVEDRKKVVMVRGVAYIPQTQEFNKEYYSRLTDWLEKGVFKPTAFEVVPNGLVGIPAGLERLRNNEVSAKKLVARPEETP